MRILRAALAALALVAGSLMPAYAQIQPGHPAPANISLTGTCGSPTACGNFATGAPGASSSAVAYPVQAGEQFTITLSGGSSPTDLVEYAADCATYATLLTYSGTKTTQTFQPGTKGCIQVRQTAITSGSVAALITTTFTAGLTTTSNQSSCNGSDAVPYAFSFSTASTLKVIAATAGQTTRNCGGTLVSAGAATVTIEQGTGTNCGSNTTVLFGPVTVAAGTVIPLPAFNPALSGYDECIVNSAAVNIGGTLTAIKQ